MSRHWMFTSYQDVAPVWNPVEMTYLVYQQEKCPTSGRVHWQSYVIFGKRKRLSGVKALLGNVHCEIARSSPQTCLAYCSKVDTRLADPLEFGQIPLERGPTNVVSELKIKRPMEVIEENPKLWRGLRQMEALRLGLLSPRRRMTEGIFLTGSTGTGKSKVSALIGAFLGPGEVYWAQPDLKWLDGYCGQSLVIVDEFRGQVPPSLILRMVDRYPLMLPVKGGFTQFKPDMIIFTSNLTFGESFAEDIQTRDALRRRIKEYQIY